MQLLEKMMNRSVGIVVLGLLLLLLGQSYGQPIEEAKLTASDGVTGDVFGQSISLSGNRLAVGAPGSGSAYVFMWSGNGWIQEAKLTASDEEANNQFGYSVSLSGNRLVIGAWASSDDMGLHSGSAYVYAWDGGSWVQEAKLTASDGEAGNSFGRSVSLSSDRLVVTAYKGYHEHSCVNVR